MEKEAEENAKKEAETKASESRESIKEKVLKSLPSIAQLGILEDAGLMS